MNEWNEWKGTCHGVLIIWLGVSVKGALAKKVMGTCFIHIETKAGMEEDGQEQRIHVQQKDKVVEFV